MVLSGWEAEANEALAGIRLHGGPGGYAPASARIYPDPTFGVGFWDRFRALTTRRAAGIPARIRFASTAYGCERGCDEAVVDARVHGRLIVSGTEWNSE